MARRKMTKRKSGTPAKRTTRRKRRISGTGSLNLQGTLMKVLGLGAGAVGARSLNTILVKQFPTLSPLLSAGIQVAVGVALPMFVKGSKFVADMGDGAIGNGVMVGMVNLGVISGAGNSTMTYRINGAPNFRTIAGAGRRRIAGSPNFNTMAGSPNFNTMAGPGVTAPPSKGRMRFM